MPDLMTHTAAGLILNKMCAGMFHNKQYLSKYLFFFLLGNIFPDLFSRVPMMLFPKYTPFYEPYHSLFCGLLIAYMFTLLFKLSQRKHIFLFVIAGAVFHQLLDLIQKDIFGTGYKMFFPLNLDISIGFIWPEDSIYVLPVLAVIVIIIYRNIVSDTYKKAKKYKIWGKNFSK